MHPAVRQHEELAAHWEFKYQKRAFARRERLIASSLDDFDLKGNKWLDAGCGTGRFSRLLVEKGAHVVGVDAAPAMLAAARDAAQAAGFKDNPSFEHVGAIESLPYESGSFDGILCTSVLEYVEDPSRCLSEMFRTLKPVGLLLLTVPNRSSLVRRGLVFAFRITKAFGRPWPRFLEVSRHEYSRNGLCKLLVEKGFEIIRIVPFGGPTPTWLQKRSFAGSLWLSIARKRDKGS